VTTQTKVSPDVDIHRTGYSPALADERGRDMDDQTQGTLTDEDIRTVLPGGGVATKVETVPDTDDTDGTDTEDGKDADGTDTQDADGTDGDTTDGTDGDSSDTA
jgi:hypothetical protein